ncbi:MAG TPA: CYTH domain-containing protein, partial [Candidatus Limnocylindrales bacterium]|nr:CYTH domain-containing protein [Candidatus Limnocylindrales bacterium]
MDTELEAKWLDINHDEIRQKLTASGATLVQPERLMTHKVFDFEDKRLDQMSGWVRVRNEGDKVTMSYKQLNDRTLHGTKEVTLEVNDFDTATSFLESIGLKPYSYQETKRESWRIGDVQIELDTWPWIPSFLEIEAPSEEDLKNAAAILGLDYSKALHGSVETAYQDVYD